MLFALDRFPDGDELPDEHDLNEGERARRARLEQELVELTQIEPPAGLRSPAGASLDSGFWQFKPGMDVSIVCAPLPDDLRDAMPYADPRSPDYVELLTYTDLDSLFELYGHIRAVNPSSQVNLRLASALRDDDYTAHLVVLGGVDWNVLTRDLLTLINVPVVPLPSDDPQGAGFVVVDDADRQTFRPDIRINGAEKTLMEDVAHFYRGPNPFNRDRTVTICSGTHGRGTYAAVRTLTDARFRMRNGAYVRDRFAGSAAFSILARARMVRGKAVTPDWSVSSTRLHEWAEFTD